MSTDNRLRLAVLMACYNRRDATLKCLEVLFDQILPEGASVSVYLVDDGSTDGTGDAVRERFSAVTVLQGDGNLYWTGGMRVAWAKAMENDYDYYLWLNDDTVLLPGAIATLLKTAQDVLRLARCKGIVVGSCRDHKTGQHTYGGRVKRSWFSKIPFEHVQPGTHMLPCDTMNGNVVLVPREAVLTLGNLSAEYIRTMGFGDMDYGLRAKKAGIPIWIAPGHLAECSASTRVHPWTDPQIPLAERWQDMCSPLGLAPRHWYTFVKRHTGYAWPVYFAKPLVRVLFPRLWTLRNGK
jgi:GT2 family glycosyltransferase